MRVADEVAGAVSTASRHRLGMLLLLNPSAAIAGGVQLDALVSRELLVAIFTPEYTNRLHQGAVLIRGGRVERAAVPFAWTDVVERATEFAGGVAVAVDEDTGKIQVVDRTGLVEIVEVDELARVLYRRALGTGRFAR